MRQLIGKWVEWLGGHELVVMLGTLAVVGSGWAFVRIADLVADGQTRDFDNRLLLALRDPGDRSRPIGPEWLEEVARDLTALGSTVNLGLATLAVAGFLALDRRYSAMAFVLIAVLGGWILTAG